MNLKRISLQLGVAIALALGLAQGTARADFITTINTDGTSTAGGGADVTAKGGGNSTVNAQLVIDFASDGTLTLTLKNLLSSTTMGGQELTGIAINTSPSLTVGSLTNTYGQLTNTNASGDFVETGATTLDNQNQFKNGSSTVGTGTSSFNGGTGTGLNGLGASNWTVNQPMAGEISVFGGAKPAQSVVSASGNANVQQTPVFLGQVTLVAGTNENLLSHVVITGITFQFGTGPGVDVVTLTNVDIPVVNPTGSVVPAPSSSILFGVGALGLIGFAGVRRFRRLPVAA